MTTKHGKIIIDKTKYHIDNDVDFYNAINSLKSLISNGNELKNHQCKGGVLVAALVACNIIKYCMKETGLPPESDPSRTFNLSIQNKLNKLLKSVDDCSIAYDDYGRWFEFKYKMPTIVTEMGDTEKETHTVYGYKLNNLFTIYDALKLKTQEDIVLIYDNSTFSKNVETSHFTVNTEVESKYDKFVDGSRKVMSAAMTGTATAIVLSAGILIVKELVSCIVGGKDSCCSCSD